MCKYGVNTKFYLKQIKYDQSNPNRVITLYLLLFCHPCKSIFSSSACARKWSTISVTEIMVTRAYPTETDESAVRNCQRLTVIRKEWRTIKIFLLCLQFMYQSCSQSPSISRLVKANPCLQKKVPAVIFPFFLHTAGSKYSGCIETGRGDVNREVSSSFDVRK